MENGTGLFPSVWRLGSPDSFSREWFAISFLLGWLALKLLNLTKGYARRNTDLILLEITPVLVSSINWTPMQNHQIAQHRRLRVGTTEGCVRDSRSLAP